MSETRNYSRKNRILSQAIACVQLGAGGGGTPLQAANRDVPLAAGGWGRIFMTGVTIMGSHFQ